MSVEIARRFLSINSSHTDHARCRFVELGGIAVAWFARRRQGKQAEHHCDDLEERFVVKVFVGLLAAVLVVIGAAKFAYNASTDTGDGPAQAAWAQNRIEFVTWNDEKWTAWVHEGSFELVPEDDSNWSRHANASIAYKNWQGESWQAKIDGDSFSLASLGNWQGEIERAHAIHYRDWEGNNQLRTVADLRR